MIKDMVHKIVLCLSAIECAFLSLLAETGYIEYAAVRCQAEDELC